MNGARELTPAFPITSALFCAFAQVTFPRNPFVFLRLRTFTDNHRGWGYLPFLGALQKLEYAGCNAVQQTTGQEPRPYLPLPHSKAFPTIEPKPHARAKRESA